MGDRVVFHIHDGTDMSPGIYGHWSGSHWREYVELLKRRMLDRTGDVQYAAARLVGILHDTPGCLSLGIWNAPAGTFEEQLAAIRAKDYSHGDAGVVIIDCRDWSAEAVNGYAERDKG